MQSRIFNKENELFLAAMNGRSMKLKSLIQEKVNINVINEKNGKETPLMWAAYHGHTECVQILIESKADLDIKDKNGNTALMQSIWLLRTSCIEMLIQAKADLNIQNNLQLSPLMEATDRGYIKCVKMLIQGKADLNPKNTHQFTALTIAANKFHSECIAALVIAGATLSQKEADTPAELLKRLQQTDLRNQNALLAIDKLLKEHKESIPEIEFKLAQGDFAKRIKLFNIHKKNIFLAFDKGMGVTMPIVLLDLITQYQPLMEISLQNYHSFFSHLDTDAIFAEEEKFEATITNKLG